MLYLHGSLSESEVGINHSSSKDDSDANEDNDIGIAAP